MFVGCSNRSTRQHLLLPVFFEHPLWVDIFQAVSVNCVGSQFSKAFSIFYSKNEIFKSFMQNPRLESILGKASGLCFKSQLFMS